MSEQTAQEFELDDFWDRLVMERLAIVSDTPEAATVETMARLPMPEPRTGFFDSLWTSMQQSDAAMVNGHLTMEPSLQSVPQPIVPVPILRPVEIGHRERWARIVAAVAAVLVIGAVSALLLSDRWRNANEISSGAQWSQSGGGPGKENTNPDSPAMADPTTIWQIETNGRFEGAPVIADGVLFVGNGNNRVYAFDASNGLLQWEANLRKPITQTVAVGDGIVVTATSSALFGLDVATGKPRWQRDDIIASEAPAIVGEVVVVVDEEHRVRALSRDTGEDRWLAGPFDLAPAFAIDEAHEHVVLTTGAQAVIALAIEDGAEQWTVNPGFGALGVPLVADGVVFAPFDGGVVRIDGANGKVERANRLSFSGVPALALAGNQLIGSTDAQVLSFDRDSLDANWSEQILSGLTGSLSVGSSSIYLLGTDRTLTALDVQTGETQWTLQLDDVAQAAPSMTSQGLYVATRVGTVYAFGESDTSVIAAPRLSPEIADSSVAIPLWKSTGGPHALMNPTGIAVSPSGEIWVCDTANDRLQIFDSEGNFLREFGAHGSGPGQFDFGAETAEMEGNAPLGNACGLAFDASGALYVADAANFRVQRFPASAFGWMANACCTIQAAGTIYPFPASAAQPDLIVGTEGTGDGQFLFPTSVAVAPNGDIYVGDGRRLDVQRFDANGNLLEAIGKPTVSANGDQLIVEDALESGSFVTIDGIAVDDQGRLYVADDSTQEIERLALDGSWTTIQLTREDYRISGIAVDEFGNVFVAQINTIGGCFSIYDPDGALLGRVGSYGTELGQFDSSTGVALDGLGNVYVTDWAMNRFQKFAIDYRLLEAIGAESTR